MKPIIVIKLRPRNYGGYVNLGNRVFASMTGNVNYTTPVPALLALQTAVTAVETAQDAWGDESSPYTHVELIDAGADTVAAQVSAEVRGIASGASVPWSYWQVVTFRDGKALRIEWFADRAEALSAVGLEE